MLSAAVQFAVSAAVIVGAGVLLTRCADAIADLTKLGRLLVGTIFLAAATSLPELSVDASAALQDLPDVGVGDLFGSCLFNLLILAVLDLLHHSRGRMLSRVSAAHALAATMSMALVALAGIALLGRWNIQVGPWGLGSLLIVLAYLVGIRLVFYDQQFVVVEQSGEPQAVLVPARRMTLAQAIGGYVAAAAVIIVVAPFLASAAGELAKHTGVGQTFVGTTLVALSTSLPELVTTLAAVRMGAFDLALGNIFGSNSFNMLLIAVVDGFYGGPLLSDVSSTHALTCLATILVTAVAVMGQLYRMEKRIRFLEPDAAMVIALVLAALATVYYMEQRSSSAGDVPAAPHSGVRWNGAGGQRPDHKVATVSCRWPKKNPGTNETSVFFLQRGGFAFSPVKEVCIESREQRNRFHRALQRS